MKIAQQEGAQPPAQPSKPERSERAKLEKLNGQAFDQAFVKQTVQNHQKDIKYFQKEQDSLKDPRLKSFAQQTLPVLREHLKMAQETEQATTGSGSSPIPRRILRRARRLAPQLPRDRVGVRVQRQGAGIFRVLPC